VIGSDSRSSLERPALFLLTNVRFTSDAGGDRRGLEEAIATFEYAEAIGFDTGWVRQRRFDNYPACRCRIGRRGGQPSCPPGAGQFP